MSLKWLERPHHNAPPPDETAGRATIELEENFKKLNSFSLIT